MTSVTPSTPFQIKRGDTFPALAATLSNSAGVINLTGATVELILTPLSGAINPVTGLPATKVQGACTIISATLGQVQYNWGATDTSIAGNYYAEFQITYLGGGIQTVPTVGYIPVQVIANLTGTG